MSWTSGVKVFLVVTLITIATIKTSDLGFGMFFPVNQKPEYGVDGRSLVLREFAPAQTAIARPEPRDVQRAESLVAQDYGLGPKLK